MRRGIIFIFTFLLLVSFASAINTEIKIYTLSNHSLNLQFLNPEPPPISFESVTETSDISGEFSYIFSSNAESFDLSIFLIEDGKKILNERFNGIVSGKKVVITFIPGLVEIDKDYQEPSVEEINVSAENQTIEINEVENQTEEVIEKIEELKEEISGRRDFESLSGFFKSLGFVSSEESFFSKKIFYYWAGGFLLFIALFFISKPVRKKLKNSYSARKEDIKEKEESLVEAKRELMQMQKKVDDLKEQKDNKIKIVKQKLVEDEKELMRLRQEEKEEKDG
jgi:hypothetical protein